MNGFAGLALVERRKGLEVGDNLNHLGGISVHKVASGFPGLEGKRQR